MTKRTKLDDKTIIQILEDRQNGLGILKASKKYKLGQSTIRKLEEDYHIIDNNLQQHSDESADDDEEKITLEKIYNKLLVIENNTDTYDIFEHLEKGERYCDLISKYWNVFSVSMVGVAFLYQVFYSGELIATLRKHISSDKK